MPFQYPDTNLLINTALILINNQPTGLAGSYMARLVAVSSVTEHELRIKQNLETYARNKNSTFGDYIKNTYERMNGRIKVESIKEILKKFGGNFADDFRLRIEELSRTAKTTGNPDPVTDYVSLINNRHGYVHNGIYNSTLDDTIKFFKNSILVLDELEHVLI